MMVPSKRPILCQQTLWVWFHATRCPAHAVGPRSLLQNPKTLWPALWVWFWIEGLPAEVLGIKQSPAEGGGAEAYPWKEWWFQMVGAVCFDLHCATKNALLPHSLLYTQMLYTCHGDEVSQVVFQWQVLTTCRLDQEHSVIHCDVMFWVVCDGGSSLKSRAYTSVSFDFVLFQKGLHS
jgi:hypothetical protein